MCSLPTQNFVIFFTRVQRNQIYIISNTFSVPTYNKKTHKKQS